MRDHQDPIQDLLELLGDHAPELLPTCRYLILGPYLSEGLLGDHTCPPTVRDLIMLKRVVERHGPGMTGLLTSLVAASGRSPAVRVESQLDRLLELDPTQWRIPAATLDPPAATASDLLEACRLRMEQATDQDRGRLAVVAEKLERTVRFEAKARERREAWANKGLTSA